MFSMFSARLEVMLPDRHVQHVIGMARGYGARPTCSACYRYVWRLWSLTDMCTMLSLCLDLCCLTDMLSSMLSICLEVMLPDKHVHVIGMCGGYGARPTCSACYRYVWWLWSLTDMFSMLSVWLEVMVPDRHV